MSTYTIRKNNSKHRALRSELTAFLYLYKKGYGRLKWRQKVFGVEIDGVMRSAHGHLVLVEVKTVSDWERLCERVSPSQKKRLALVQAMCESRWELEVELLFVFVGVDGEIHDLSSDELGVF